MIDRDVAAAFRAIAAFADVAALELPQELRAFGDVYVFLFPQRERAHGRGGITSAVFAMAVTHLHGFTAYLDFHRSAVTCGCVRVSHRVTT